tara:strand:- start:542 stop:736 length:195 start_codon:yes stop_codon:yes gene_type:complete
MKITEYKGEADEELFPEETNPLNANKGDLFLFDRDKVELVRKGSLAHKFLKMSPYNINYEALDE